MMKLALLKVVCQPVFAAIDDNGEVVGEVVADPVSISPANWPTYATEQFPSAVATLQDQINANQPVPAATNGGRSRK
jgi:hypothetical protein